MRILIAAPYRNIVGGVEKYLQLVIPALRNRGHVVGYLHEDPLNLQMAEIEFGSAAVTCWCTAELGIEGALDSARKWAPDVVYYQGLLGPALETALLEEYPTFLYAHSYDGACISGRKCSGWPEIRACSRPLSAKCLFHYYPRRCGGLNPATMWRSYRQQTQRNSRLREYQAVLVASTHMQTEFRQYGLEDRVQLVPLPLDGGSSHPTALASKQPGGRILYVGRLVDVKGISYLIRAVAEAQSRLPRPLALTIAGEGPDRQELADLARRLSVNAVFTGWIDGPDKTELFQQSDLLAVPSLWPEPFGLTGIEAGVFGVPAVGFAVGGIPDWLITGQSGELAPGDPPSVGGLSDAIVRALADPEHYRRLCEGARSVASRHTMNNHLNRLESIFASAGQGQFSSIAAPAETPTRATLG